MPNDDSARKRRRVEAIGTAYTSEPTTGAVVFDDEAMKRHMLSLMEQSTNAIAARSDSSGDEEEDQESEGDEEESEDGDDGDGPDQSDSRGKRVQEDPDSEVEDEDDVAEALLQGRKAVKAAEDERSTSRISRVPASRSATAVTKKPVLKTTFEGLGLSPQLIRTLAGISIRKPTEIQSACFEHILNGKLTCILLGAN